MASVKPTSAEAVASLRALGLRPILLTGDNEVTARAVAAAPLVVLALAVAGVLIVVTSAIWTDPRPFMVDGVAPAFPHGADNGFPSDHTAAAAVVAGLVLAYRRRVGILLMLLAVVVGLSRVAARVHHVPDIIGGLGVGLISATLGVMLARVALRLGDPAGRVARLLTRDRV